MDDVFGALDPDRLLARDVALRAQEIAFLVRASPPAALVLAGASVAAAESAELPFAPSVQVSPAMATDPARARLVPAPAGIRCRTLS